ncbi:MAG: hypothetical protein HW394_297, partial [Acidobacteria bacterium]|nr:hypothetical protein [Acidobacteriota bacterium]
EPAFAKPRGVGPPAVVRHGAAVRTKAGPGLSPRQAITVAEAEASALQVAECSAPKRHCLREHVYTAEGVWRRWASVSHSVSCRAASSGVGP